MNKLLAKIFVKNYQNIDDPKVRNGYGMLASIIGILSNLILSVAKILIGALSASVSVIADGINNLSDMSGSGISIVGFKLSNRPADKDHPFGHARMEYISALIIAFLIIFVGVQLAITSIQSIIANTAPSTNNIAFIILGISIAIKLYMAYMYRGFYKIIKSSSLKACFVDSINDCITTSLVLIGLLITKFTAINLDGYIGVAVSLYIAISGIKLVKETLNPLLGEMPDPDMVKSIVERAKSFDGILGVHDLVCHNYGAKKYFITFHAEVDASVDVMTSHELIDRIENELSNANIHVVIHMDPIITSDKRINDLKAMVEDILFKISPSLKMHDFRVIIGPNRKNLIFDVLLPDHTSYKENVIKKIIGDMVSERDKTCFTVISIDYPFTEIN